jgi:hypothetical protein
VFEEWLEANLLPTAQRDAYFESVLTDILVSKTELSNVNSIQDCMLFVKSSLKGIVEISASGVASGAFDRLARRVWIYQVTKSIEVDTQLDKLLKGLQKNLKINNPLIEQVYVGKDSWLLLTLPDVDIEDEDTAKVLTLLVSMACSLHATDVNKVKFQKDSSYGTGTLTCSNTIKKLINDVVASAKNPIGIFPGEIKLFKSGFKGTIVDMLAAMRLLNINQEILRRTKFTKESQKTPVSFFELQESFNAMSFIKDHGDSYVKKFIKATFSSCIKKHNKGFPSGWIHSVRSQNGVKSDITTLNTLGWTEMIPSNYKFNEVIYSTVDTVKQVTDGKETSIKNMVNLTQDKRRFLHQEFRTAVALIMPQLNAEASQDTWEVDLKRDPLKVKSLKISKNFAGGKREQLVDSLNQSFSLKMSLNNPKSKTMLKHYEIARNRMLALSANIPLVDARGVEYESFSKVPAKLQKYLRDKYRYSSKRGAEDLPGETGEAMQVEGVRPTTGPPTKRVRMTRGAVKEAVRKSGRLAASKNKKM